ncbi:MAG: Uma2 family endonuclease [Isosphaeraceae bacterium]
MATAIGTTPREERIDQGVTPYRLTVEQYLKMIDLGVLPHDAHVELLGGVLTAKMTKNAPHNFAVGQLAHALRTLELQDCLIREEKSVVLGPNWRPEPDVALVRGPNDRYRTSDPTAADILLLVEVVDSSGAVDRGVKRQGYALARVPCYWIVDLSSRSIEVHTSPEGVGDSAQYRSVSVHEADSVVPVVIDGREVHRVAVKDVLP